MPIDEEYKLHGVLNNLLAITRRFTEAQHNIQSDPRTHLTTELNRWPFVSSAVDELKHLAWTLPSSGDGWTVTYILKA